MKLPVEKIKKIVIFRALQLGDMLCSIPAIRALRSAYPDAHITLVGLPWATSLKEKFPDYFNDVIPFPGYPGLPEQPADVLQFPSFIESIQSQNFDLAIQLQGNGGISNPIVALFNATYNAGFYRKNKFCPDPDLYIEYPKDQPEIIRHLTLMEHLGIQPQGVALEYPVTQLDEIELANLNLPIEPGNYIVVHPGARGVERRWEPEHFAAIADYCIDNNLPVVVTGTKEELPIVETNGWFYEESTDYCCRKNKFRCSGRANKKCLCSYK